MTVKLCFSIFHSLCFTIEGNEIIFRQLIDHSSSRLAYLMNYFSIEVFAGSGVVIDHLSVVCRTGTV